MTTTQAAEYLGVSTRTIHRLIKRGDLAAERLGNYWIIKRESLDRYKVTVEGLSKHDPRRGKVE